MEIVINGVPKYYTPINDDLFISGDLNNWSPNENSYKLVKTAHHKYHIRFSLPKGEYLFKITRGSWDTNETTLSSLFLSGRKLRVLNSINSMAIQVENWIDMLGNHTASGNVNILDRAFPYPLFSHKKQIWIYLPPDYYNMSNTKRYSVMYMHDGQNLFDAMYNFTVKKVKM